MEHHPSTLVELTTANTEFEADAIVAELASLGIQSKVFSAAAQTMRFHAAQSIRIDVRRGDLESAATALAEFRKKPIICDWAEIDTGDHSPITYSERAELSVRCASCGGELKADAAPDQRCPTCGTSLADKPPVTAAQLRQAREAKDERMVKWTLGVVAGLVLLVIISMCIGGFLNAVL